MMEKNESTRKLFKRLLSREEVRISEVRNVANDLITLAVVRETIVGRKKLAEVIDAAQLDLIVTTFYPGGVEALPSTGLEGVLLRGDSKTRKLTERAVLVLKVLSDGGETPLEKSAHAYTSSSGMAVVALPDDRMCAFGSVVIVENTDVFLEAERIFPDADMILFSNGVLNNRVVQWLESSNRLQKVTHAGDYDPTGLDDFRRLECSKLDVPIAFFLPDWLEKSHFASFGKEKLLSKKGVKAKWSKVMDHTSADQGFNLAREWILNTHKGLEQEILLSKNY